MALTNQPRVSRLLSYSIDIISYGTVRGRVQTIFVKNNVNMTFRGGKTRDVSRLLTGHLLRARGRQVTLWEGRVG